MMGTIAEQKAALRKEIRQRIRELDSAAARASSDAICKQATENIGEYAAAKTLFCFVGTKMEIDTVPIILDALGEGKTVAVPLCVGDGIMEARRITGMDDLEEGAYGILEPAASCGLVAPEEIDFAIVPCISCDRSCARLGQGGGFYDRFMDGKGFPAFALCREELLLDRVPAEPWDLPVDAVVTEHAIYRR
jgi:5-formyltetrahydrofolate cyclo-ligase